MEPTTDCGCLINAPFSALAVMLMKEMFLMLPMGTVGSRSSEVIEIHSPLPHLQTHHTRCGHMRMRAHRRGLGLAGGRAPLGRERVYTVCARDAGVRAGSAKCVA